MREPNTRTRRHRDLSMWLVTGLLTAGLAAAGGLRAGGLASVAMAAETRQQVGAASSPQ